MKHINKTGFTLIELLVVITIIGILGTGAATVYTSQIQKARDTTRITDVKAIQAAVEQVYQDSFAYPSATSFYTEVGVYLASVPADKKHGQTCNASAGTTTDCGYAYKTQIDANGIDFGFYEVSTAFENSGIVDSRAVDSADNGNDAGRYEAWIGTDAVSSTVGWGSITPNSWACSLGGAVAGAGTDVIVINGAPATSWNECG